MDAYYYTGPPTDLADTGSLPTRPRGTPWPRFTTSPCKEPTWRPELPQTTRTLEAHPAYVEASHIPGPAYGALDRTAELLAKLLSESEDPDVRALFEAVRAKLCITERLTKAAMASPSLGLTSLANDLKRSTVSRLLPKVTCPSPFHPRARRVPIAGLQDFPVTAAEKRELAALAPLAGKLPPLRIQPQGVGRVASLLPQRTSS